MKKKLLAISLLTCLMMTGCQMNDSKKESSEIKNQTNSPATKSTENNQYATEEDVVNKEETTIDQKEYIIYTFKGNKATALPKDISLEEAQIDLSLLPEVGTPKEDVER